MQKWHYEMWQYRDWLKKNYWLALYREEDGAK